MKKFCPNCGRDIERGFGERNLCLKCYSKRNDILDVSSKIEVERCKTCGRLKIGNKWKEHESEEKEIFDILDYFLDHEGLELDVSYQKEDSDYVVKVKAEKELKGKTIKQEFEARILFKSKMCQDCAKFYGGYYRYILQVRSDNKDKETLKQIEDKLKQETDRKNFVAQIEPVKNGWNFYISSRKLVDQLLKFMEEKHKLEKKESRELVGEREGKKLYRTTVLARIKNGKQRR